MHEGAKVGDWTVKRVAGDANAEDKDVCNCNHRWRCGNSRDEEKICVRSTVYAREIVFMWL